MSSIALTLTQGIDLFGAVPAAEAAGLFVQDELAGIREKLAERASNWTSAVDLELTEISRECRDANWDGYGAAPIETEVLHKARELAVRLYRLLPPGIPAPDAVPEKDGDVSLSWTRDRRYGFSVSVGPGPLLSFAGILRRGVERHGTETLDGGDPSSLEEMARYVARLYGR